MHEKKIRRNWKEENCSVSGGLLQIANGEASALKAPRDNQQLSKVSEGPCTGCLHPISPKQTGNREKDDYQH